MKVKLDENLPERLVAELVALGHDVDTVRAERSTGQPDNEIWVAPQSADRFLVTQDLDFSDMRRYTPGTHAGATIGPSDAAWPDALVARVALLFETEDVDSWRGCLVVATDCKLRVKRPS